MVIGDLITSPIEGIKRYDAFDKNIKYVGPYWIEYNNADYKAKYCDYAECSNQILFDFIGTKIIIYGFGMNLSNSGMLILDGVRYNMAAWKSITESKTGVLFVIENLENKKHSVCILTGNSSKMNISFIDCDGELYEYYPKGNKRFYLKFTNYGNMDNVNIYHSIGRIRVFQDNVEVPLSAEKNIILSDYDYRNSLSGVRALFSTSDFTPCNGSKLFTENNIIIEIDEKYKYLTKITLTSYTNTGGAKYSDIYWSIDYNNWKKIGTITFNKSNQQKSIEFHITSYIGYLVKNRDKLYSVQDKYFNNDNNFYNTQIDINKDNVENITFDDLDNLFRYKSFNNKLVKPIDLFGKLSLLRYTK